MLADRLLAITSAREFSQNRESCLFWLCTLSASGGELRFLYIAIHETATGETVSEKLILLPRETGSGGAG